MSRKPTKVSVFGIQRKIVANMTVEGWRDAPHCSYTFEPDLTEFYKKYTVFAEELKKDGKKITFNTVMMKAICEALKSAPEMNAHIKFNRKLVRGEITTFEDMGNRSLGNMTEYTAEMMRKMEKTDFAEAMFQVSFNDTIESLLKGKILKVLTRVAGSFITTKKHRVKKLSGAAKKAYDAIPDSEKITAKDIKQGTITISNTGSISRDHDGAVTMLIIIPPQVCAICINALTKKPVVETNENGEDEIRIKTTVPLTIAFDHRCLDFGEVKPFLDALQKICDNPEDILKY